MLKILGLLIYNICVSFTLFIFSRHQTAVSSGNTYNNSNNNSAAATLASWSTLAHLMPWFRLLLLCFLTVFWLRLFIFFLSFSIEILSAEFFFPGWCVKMLTVCGILWAVVVECLMFYIKIEIEAQSPDNTERNWVSFRKRICTHNQCTNRLAQHFLNVLI